MTRRLSFISSPESDRDAAGHGPCSEDEAEVMRSPYSVGRPPAPAGTRLVRSSSDPSIGAADNIPGSGALYPSGAPVYSPDIYQVFFHEYLTLRENSMVVNFCLALFHNIVCIANILDTFLSYIFLLSQ